MSWVDVGFLCIQLEKLNNKLIISMTFSFLWCLYHSPFNLYMGVSFWLKRKCLIAHIDHQLISRLASYMMSISQKLSKEMKAKYFGSLLWQLKNGPYQILNYKNIDWSSFESWEVVRFCGRKSNFSYSQTPPTQTFTLGRQFSIFFAPCVLLL